VKKQTMGFNRYYDINGDLMDINGIVIQWDFIVIQWDINGIYPLVN
jgi:hypothetical protein